MFSVTLPPENCQNNRQLMNLLASNGWLGRSLRNELQLTFAGVQSDGVGRTHWPFPCGVLRLIQDSTWVIFPANPSWIHFLALARAPELSCCSPICITRSELLAA